MRTILFTRLSSLPAVRLFFLTAVMFCLGISLINTLPAHADPANSDAVLLYCQRHVPQAARAACTTDSINGARNAATYHCVNHPTDKQAECVEQRAMIFFDDALKNTPHPKNAAAFTKALNAVIAADIRQTGGSVSQGAPGLVTSTTTTVDRTQVAAGELPHVAADQKTLKTILSILFGIIGAFALLSIVASGLRYITSQGDTQKTAEAKNGIIYSLVGLVIALSAEAIVAFVITSVKSP